MSDKPSQSIFTLYGIKNCDTIKKARHWLEEQKITYLFHDYRVDGLNETLLQSFIDKLGWESLINTRGTTWRKLTDQQRAAINNADAAKVLMLEQPALIKRPLLVSAKGNCLLGYKADEYQQFFAEGC
ncbi:ArsC family reductase [Photorhabdus heterorhabditis]|uniref:ArsC family reductase n=1 Tax=Photorhabdus heterorhabditis TaxID=880156 RepID=A0A5B0WHK5_9GAMM|nr:ArsC family reductase [Photorhabdus heterorhabditis]KAA1186366.1 ArsC family reductase [Photorhabdus heterorhabditis]KOY63405.1 ArsC family transcriptional regulator [Photorhabdus heterorhabditis]MBS9442199.1 ArsC family reductase [Photorhabdus heterorhabditis]